ncbi:MAG: hypothetical protein ACRD3C_27105 [Vicinamibacterales bacterium]
MFKTFTITAVPSGAHRFAVTCVILAALALGARQAHAQGRDGLLNGAMIGAGVGAGIGVAFTHAVHDSDLEFGQYAYGALVVGAIGAGVGLGVDALLSRVSPGSGVTPRRMFIAPTVWRHVTGVAVKWKW